MAGLLVAGRWPGGGWLSPCGSLPMGPTPQHYRAATVAPSRGCRGWRGLEEARWQAGRKAPLESRAVGAVPETRDEPNLSAVWEPTCPLMSLISMNRWHLHPAAPRRRLALTQWEETKFTLPVRVEAVGSSAPRFRDSKRHRTNQHRRLICIADTSFITDHTTNH